MGLRTQGYRNWRVERPPLRRVLPDILAFGCGLLLAWGLRWQARDLVWSLWLCSLVVGYMTLLSALAAGAIAGIHALRQKEFPAKRRLPAALGGLGAGLFLLGFFSLHFCGFHAGHSVFLQFMFPIEGLPKDGFGRAFSNPLLLWILVFRHLIGPYGAFALVALVAEREHVFRPLALAIRWSRGEKVDGAAPPGPSRRDKGRGGDSIGDFMGRPYLNVVRMHLLIFFFAFCHLAKIDSFLVYAVVYAVYFFPWREVFGPRPARAR